MKRSVFYKLLSMLLVFALLVELLPVSAFAAPDVEETPAAVQEELLPEIGNSESTEEQDIETPEGEEAQGNARVVGEITELREEGIKHFRMDDGSFIAVDYGMPVHFTTDGGESWEPIDNTLTLTAAETPTGEQDENINMEPISVLTRSRNMPALLEARLQGRPCADIKLARYIPDSDMEVRTTPLIPTMI